ncbi:50S ribosomal protein L29 [Marichromatium gracile]|uniref:Large ribosomal subunit protein uL29 n=2 Tax=Marichromatium TaxID=85076 RepID=W0DX95_MARPU|nr:MULTISPECIES: 50S ribosomal protein L29 [Marichromatium]MBO8084736.1 50S ribosomal protein L29 [Marichromatium sp.]AHF03087.1 50S ribosomal protein L29 [Marichromatium purpuratum 984]KXX64978.1 50S ribosomal protein L29 [Marichromatium gracile]MBK1708633.1 50S ribosomal protein L29 [Marichromatium gracile]MCF1184390.1 50S ribosomal protein L29 [Marichromatium gracile]
MKANELRQSSLDELQARLMDLLREQFNLRMQQGTGQLSKPSQMKAVRRDIARIKTVMAEMAGKQA